MLTVGRSVAVIGETGQKRKRQVMSESSVHDAAFRPQSALAVCGFVQFAVACGQAQKQRNYKKQQFGSHFLARMRLTFERRIG